MAKKLPVKKVKKKPEKRASLACPHCNALFSRVESTDPGADGITRYRRCNRCGKRFPTEEKRKWG
jgi:predicted Zn finger-like uncharacterized protein